MTDSGREPAGKRYADGASGSTATLLLDPPDGNGRHGACIDDLQAAGPNASRICRVEFTRTIDAWLSRWASGSRPQPETCVVVNATGVDWSTGSSSPPSWVELEQETAPSNLTRIGTTVTGFLNRHQATDGRARVCVHSLTTLLQYVSAPQAYQFLHQLVEQAGATGAYVHYHLTAGVHDERTVNLFTTLADVVVTVDDGERPADTTR